MTQYRSDTNVLLPHNKTIYEVFRLSDRLTTSGTSTDAFGRLRISDALTLFDSQHRYRPNPHWNTNVVGSGSVGYIQPESTVTLNVTTASGDTVQRETNRVFAYQPGKSLLIMNTFAMANAQPGLVQRVGYFGANNGIYLESNGASGQTSFVLRSNVSGTTIETRVPQTEWNADKFGADQNSYSYQIASDSSRGPLNLANTNIMWMDIEWLGVGDVRCGFVVDGLMVPAHVFHNDNKRSTVYMTTACLPLRYEIFNLTTTTVASSMKQICSTMISEGGYQLSGSQRTVGNTTPYTLTTPGTFYPIISLRLSANNPDSIVVPTNISLLGLSGNGQRIQWRLIEGASVSGGTWESGDANSSVLYNTSATSMSGGIAVKSGYVYVSQQGSAPLQLGDSIFRNQLKRNSFNNSNVVFTLAAAGSGSSDTCVATMDWEEVV